MFCQNCGSENKPESEFCSNCGESLQNGTAPERRVHVHVQKDDSILFAVITLIMWLLLPPVGLILNVVGLITGPKRGCFIAMLLVLIIPFIILVALVLGAGVFGVMETGRVQAEEVRAMANLQAIAKAQEMYRAQFNKYGALAELNNQGFIDDPLATGKVGPFTYKFTQRPSATKWEITATSSNTLSSSFKMGEDGLLYRNRSNDASGAWIEE